MFGLVKKNKDIEQLLKILEMDAANNYKDAVQEDIKRIETEIASQESIGKLKENQTQLDEARQTKSDLILQEHQRALLYISFLWNVVWIGVFVVLVEVSIVPLEAFFYSELVAMLVQLTFCYFIYRRDKKTLLRI